MCAALLLPLLLAAGARRVDAAGFRAIISPLMMQTDAKASCVAQGGFLATVSAGNFQEVSELFSGSFTILDDNVTWFERHAFWIGAEDRANEGKFLWQDGSAVVDAKWAQSDSLWGDEDCAIVAHLNKPGQLPGWYVYDFSCEAMLRFVCQIDSLDANEMSMVASKEATNASQVAKTEKARLAAGAMEGIVVVHPAPCERVD